MSTFSHRTDLALESRDLAVSASGAQNIEGVEFSSGDLNGIAYSELLVKTHEGSEAIGKAQGAYYTLDICSLIKREEQAFENSVTALSELLKRLINDESTTKPVLVVGLGNRDITPDAIGPDAAAQILVTRHLKEKMPQDFAAFSSVSAIVPGVLGTSGIESFDFINAMCKLVDPRLVIAIDALAARSFERLCSTVQITDAGISPGSGVGNARPEISMASLGVPVIAVGVPTVVDLTTVFADHEQANAAVDSSKLFKDSERMIVTPRSIDSLVTSAARVVSYGINLALHDGITIEDVDMLLC